MKGFRFEVADASGNLSWESVVVIHSELHVNTFLYGSLGRVVAGRVGDGGLVRTISPGTYNPPHTPWVCTYARGPGRQL